MNILSERLREGAAYEEEHNEEEMDTAGISFLICAMHMKR